MLTYSFSKKLPGLIALCALALLLGLILIVSGGPVLTEPMSNWAGMGFSLLTDSAGKPTFLITVAILCLIPLMSKQSKQQWVKLCLQFGVLLILCFAAKTGLKNLTKEARPYTHELQQLGLVTSPQAFYALPKAGKEKAITEASDSISLWRVANWKKDCNYSFPSGHSIFASLVVLMWGGFFLRRRQLILAGIIVLWGLGVSASRVWLGMHWPHDVFGSMLCAAIIYLIVPSWKDPEIKNRNFKYRR